MRNAIIRGMGNGYLQKQLVNDTVEIMSRKQGHENLIFNYFDQKNRKQGKVMKRKRRKIKLILLLLNCILCMILFGIVLVIYVKKVDEGTLGCGISVYGLDISQCTPEQAVKEIEETFRNKEVVFQENGQNVFETTVGNMGYVLDQSLLMKELLIIKKQRDQNRGMFEKRKDYSIEYEIKMEDKMEEVLNIEDFNLGERIESSDAYIDYDEQKESFILVDEIQGNQIDKKKLVEKVYNTLAEDFQEQLLSSRVEIEINRQVYQTAVSSEVSELNRKLEELNRQLLQYRTTTVTYIFGDTVEVLDNERISSWLIVSGDSISINEEEVIAFVKDLSSKYNTMYVPRSFRTSLGEEVTISGNEYGYRIDKDAELQKLLEDIKSGDDVRREPVYSKQGLERNGKDDLLGSYIEVSLDKQYLWLYKNGKLVTKTDIISGLPNEEFQTYRGAWPIAYKASPFTLSSDVYGYEIEVEYWMPFVYGQGLHDADWQDVFGGELYKTKGSHGCINLPTPLKVIAAEENLNVNEFPQLQSETAVLMDAETGQILYQKEMNKKMYPASITKIVTGMLALKNAQLTETITMSYDAVFSIDRDSSHIALDVNEQITLEQALYALTIESANDAANGIAELVGGSMEEFVDMMNQTAKDAGAINTNFSNAHGLFDENHYTTSYDMAKITAEAITVPGFTDFFSETYYEIPPTNKQPDTRYIRSNNRLLNGDIPYEGIVMSKTGWTPESQHTLVAVAEQNSTTLIAVVMKSPMADQKWDDIVTLFDYGFTQFYRADFSAAQLTQQLETKEQKKISGLSDFSLLLPEGTSSNDVKAHLDSVADDMGKLPVEVSLCIQTANAKNPEDDLFETTVEVTSLSEKNNPIKDDNSLTGKNDSVPQSSNMRGIVAGIAAVSLILLLFYVLATYRRQQLRRRRKKRHTKRHDR